MKIIFLFELLYENMTLIVLTKSPNVRGILQIIRINKVGYDTTQLKIRVFCVGFFLFYFNCFHSIFYTFFILTFFPLLLFYVPYLQTKTKLFSCFKLYFLQKVTKQKHHNTITIRQSLIIIRSSRRSADNVQFVTDCLHQNPICQSP